MKKINKTISNVTHAELHTHKKKRQQQQQKTFQLLRPKHFYCIIKCPNKFGITYFYLHCFCDYALEWGMHANYKSAELVNNN